MKVAIIGSSGVFGTFLTRELAPHVEILPEMNSDEADVVILSVPVSAFDEVAAKHVGQHLVNICSVQRFANTV
jgi:prephenate dehydrogenase